MTEDGGMQDGFQLAAVNYVIKRGATEEEDLLSVTLCSLGSAEEYLAKDSKATLLKPEHAWHHRVCWQHFIEHIPTLDVNVRRPFLTALHRACFFAFRYFCAKVNHLFLVILLFERHASCQTP